MAAALTDSLLTERSLTGRQWRLREGLEGAAQAIAREHDVPELLARIVAGRVAPEEAHGFLNPSLKVSLPDPGHLKDMDVAAERLASAVIAGETVAVFGDYDVDGATSSALLKRFFKALGREAIVYIPDRLKEGYGPNTPALLGLKERGASVIVTVDCGTLAFEPLEAAHEAGVDVIVVDHHQGEARRPRALAIVNPNRLDETSPHRHLAAVGVSFLLAVAVQRALRGAGYFAARPEPDLMQLLDLVALGTVCDVVPLIGVNRAFVAQGLKVMAGRRQAGLRVLMDVARLDGPPSAYHLGFLLGPRINAGGRVGAADYGTKLLACDDEAEALPLAKALDQYNDERKAIEAIALEEAFAQAEAQAVDLPMIVATGRGWHPGVIGIVAGRLKERYGKPAAVIALDGATGKASARSVPGFDFGAAVIAAVEAGLLMAGGGHAMAAGFTVAEEKIAPLREFFLQRLQSAEAGACGALNVDACLSIPGVTVELARMLERAGPYGAGNAQARLCVREARVASAAKVGKDHVRLILVDENRARLTALAFRCEGTPFGRALLGLPGRTVHALGTLRLSTWQGEEQASFTLEDVAVL